MTCDDARSRLTAYLDGELEGDRGGVVRGHLRECAPCRQVARDEAALRDGLRSLPPLDPPSSMWAGVQAKLAAAEVAESKRPAWRRAVSRWLPSAPRFAAGGLVAAAAVTLLWWRAHRPDADEPVGSLVATVHDQVASLQPPPQPAQPLGPSGDVTSDLAAEPALVTDSYAQAAAELFALATEARAQWDNERKAAFDARLASLRTGIANAEQGRPRQRAWRSLIRYLQGAVIRNDVVLASGAPR